MSNFKTSAIVAALASASTVAAHGFVKTWIVNGVAFPGFDVTNPGAQTVAAWSATNTDLGFVSPSDFGGPNIACHMNGKPGAGYITVAAGSTVSAVWNTWPESHHGPMLDYLAACNGPCSSVDKSALSFFKIDEAGLLDNTQNPGKYGDDVMMANGLTWTVQIPADLTPGEYVLRHETIALHSADQANGAQAYPQCVNLKITGSGSNSPAGVPATGLYKATDPGIAYNIYVSGNTYPIPGPALIAGAAGTVAQAKVAATSTGAATVGGGQAAGTPAGGSPATTAGPASAAPTSAKAVATTNNGAAAPVPTTMATVTKPASSANAAASPTPAAGGNGGAQSLWGQCGGSAFAGPTACATGSCKVLNPWYSQCQN